MSSEKLSGIIPYRLMRPLVGSSPTMPHTDAGRRTEPPVSDPNDPKTSEAATAAADSVEMPDELHVSLAGATGPAAYPIASYTYLLVYDDAKDVAKGQALARFVWWATHDGQKYAKGLDYAPLPAKVVSKVEAKLRQLHAGGLKLLDGV